MRKVEVWRGKSVIGNVWWKQGLMVASPATRFPCCDEAEAQEESSALLEQSNSHLCMGHSRPLQEIRVSGSCRKWLFGESEPCSVFGPRPHPCWVASPHCWIQRMSGQEQGTSCQCRMLIQLTFLEEKELLALWRICKSQEANDSINRWISSNLSERLLHHEPV